MNIETVECAGWKNNLKLSNDACELIVTLDVGPRVLHFAARENGANGDSASSDSVSGENVFCLFAEQLGTTGEVDWQSRGGHRLWLAPEAEEAHPFTYFPDNAPVSYEVVGGDRVRFMSPVEASGVQKEIEIELDAREAKVTVTHRITNAGSETLASLAPWALSVMAAGGVAVVPFAELGEHPRDLLPNRSLILWTYTDLSDPRLYIGRSFLTLSQDTVPNPIKIGLGHAIDWAGYWNQGTFFVKKWAFDASAKYPDTGSTCELFTNKDMLEVESLAPLVELGLGQSATHIEEWRLFSGVPAFEARDEASIRDALKGLPL